MDTHKTVARHSVEKHRYFILVGSSVYWLLGSEGTRAVLAGWHCRRYLQGPSGTWVPVYPRASGEKVGEGPSQ